MSLEPQINVVEIKYNKKLDEITFQSNIILTTNGEKIDKVLFTKSLINIQNTNINKGNITIEGVINSTALVKLENGELEELKTSTNFSNVYNSNQITGENKIIVLQKSIETLNLSVNEISISFSEQVVLELFSIEKQNVKYVSQISPANQKLVTEEFSTITHSLNENFELNTEIDLPTSISKILMVESYTITKNVSCLNDLIICDGVINTNLIYLTNDEQPKLKNQTYSQDFHQELLGSGVCEGQNATIFLNTLENNYEVDGEIGSSKGVLELKNKFCANVLVRKNIEIESVFDAFCPRKELEIEHSSFMTQNVVCCKNIIEKIDGNIEFSENDIRIDKVLCSSVGNCYIKNKRIEKDEVIISGNMSCYVVYLLDDEAHTMQSAKVEIPFESSFVCENVLKDDEIFVSVNIKEIDARNKRAKEIDVLAEVCLNVFVLQSKNEVIMSNIVVGEDRKLDLCNMGIYVINKAEDSWDIAKKLLINPDILLSQNPELKFPITKPTQIIVYRQKKLN